MLNNFESNLKKHICFSSILSYKILNKSLIKDLFYFKNLYKVKDMTIFF